MYLKHINLNRTPASNPELIGGNVSVFICVTGSCGAIHRSTEYTDNEEPIAEHVAIQYYTATSFNAVR